MFKYENLYLPHKLRSMECITTPHSVVTFGKHLLVTKMVPCLELSLYLTNTMFYFSIFLQMHFIV